MSGGKRHLITLLFFLGLCLTGSDARVAPEASRQPLAVLVLTDQQAEYRLGPYLDILPDPQKGWTIEQVAAPEFAGRFVPYDGSVLSLGFSQSAYWVRLQVRNEAPQVVDWRLEVGYSVDHVDLYQTVPGEAGMVKPANPASLSPARGVVSRNVIFAILLPPDSTETLYLRLQSDSALYVPLTLWEPDAFTRQNSSQQFALGLLYGAFLLMIVANLVLARFMRDGSQALYTLALVAAVFGLSVRDGLWWITAPHWTQASSTNALMALVGAGAIFSQSLLQRFYHTREQMPGWHRVIIALQAITGLYMIWACLGLPFRYQLELAMIAHVGLTFFGVSLTAWRRGYRPARFHAMAWMVVDVTIVISALARWAILPGLPWLAEYGPHVGCMVLLVMAPAVLADKFRLLREQRDQAQVAFQHEQEEALHTQEKLATTLRETNAMLAAIFDASPMAVIATDTAGVVTHWNPAAESMFGWPAAEVVGKVGFTLPPGAQNEFEAYQELLQQARPSIHLETVRRRRDGTVFPVSIEAAMLRGEGGTVRGIVAVMADVTERKETEEQLVRSEKLAALGRLLAALAHEMNNPLQAIQMGTDLLCSSSLDGDEAKRCLYLVRSEMERLVTLTGRVLSFARPIDVERRQVQVAEIVRDALALAGNQLQLGQVQVCADLHDNLDPVMASPDLLAQVFLNLIINAQEAMPDGGQLRITARELDHSITVMFADTGPGIAAQILPHLFEPFYTTKAAGNGLGLHIAHRIVVEQHGGTIAVNNAPEGGALVTVTLPVVQ